MIWQRRAYSRWISVVTASLLIAGFLVTGNAFAAPSLASASPAGCDSKQSIAFIGIPGVDNLGPMVRPLRKLREIWPVQRLAFRYMTSAPDFDGPELDTIVDELEGRVDYLESIGFNRIGLPSRSALLTPFIYGTAGSLGGQTLTQRHPDTVFVTMNNGASSTEDPVAASNAFRFLDVPTIDESASLAVDNLVGPSGQMLIVFQESDVVSETIRDNYLDIASNLGIAASTAAVTYADPNFALDDLTAAVAQKDALPTGSLVVHVVNGALSDQYAFNAYGAGLFTDESDNGPIRHFGGNFFPTTTELPVRLELGYQLVDRPSWQSTRAGFSNRYVDFQNDPRMKLYMDAYGFLARCGKFNGILDGFLRFDEGGTRINKEIQRIYIEADATGVSFGERIDNERWYDDKVVWDWDQVFGE